MASSHGSNHSEAARVEQIVTEFFAKSLHIILESRSPFVSSRNYSGDQAVSSPSSSASSSSSMRLRDKWFNLALRDCPAALENIDFWRQSNFEPMVVDVILVQRALDEDQASSSPKLVRNLSLRDRFPNYWNSLQEKYRSAAKSEKIIERWVIQYESRKSRESSSGSRKSSFLQTLYKKSILLLRSLYLTVRLLPAYKLFRDLNLSGQIHTFTLAARVLSFVEPFTHREDSEMQHFGFTPVDTLCGRLCLSVAYRSSLSDMVSEPSNPMAPKFITDYVGSPIADPIKRLPSCPVTEYGFPSSPFERPHSWSHGIFKALPRPSSLPSCPAATSVAHNEKTSFDETCPSPTILHSPSQSPPHVHGSNLSKLLLRSESAPIRIAASAEVNSPGLTDKPMLQPSPPFKGSRLNSSKADKYMGLFQTGATNEKLYLLGKDESRKLSGVKTSCNSSPRISVNSSPQISISRSSSRFSLQDDLDDSEFSCPFIVDDDDRTDTSNRLQFIDLKGHLGEQVDPGGSFPIKQSQQAAVGALVQILKKAPPLCHNFSNSASSSQALKAETWSDSSHVPNQVSQYQLSPHAASSSVMTSGLAMSKTTADALEELRGYRDLKDTLLNKATGPRP